VPNAAPSLGDAICSRFTTPRSTQSVATQPNIPSTFTGMNAFSSLPVTVIAVSGGSVATTSYSAPGPVRRLTSLALIAPSTD
jgi:hypothetical protein